MIKSTRSRATLFVGVTLLGVCLAVAVLDLPVVIVLLTGAVLAVAMAALAASQQDHRHADGRYGNGRADERSKSTTIAVCVLGGLILLPFIAVGALIVAGTDPLAVYLIATGLFASVGVLVVIFLGVYFILRWRGRRRTKVRPVRRSG